MYKKPKIFIITDAGRDHDDELALAVLAGLQKQGACELVGAIANLHPTKERARLVKGALLSMGIDIPVAQGYAGEPCSHPKSYEFAAPYLAEESAIESDGQALLKHIFSQASENGEKISLLLISGMMDANQFLMEQPSLVSAALERVVIMGGIATHPNGTPILQDNLLMPDTSYNNCVDGNVLENPIKNPIGPSALNLYRLLQQQNIPTTILTKFAAYKAAVPPVYYDALAQTGHPVGIRLQRDQKAFIDNFWSDILEGKAAARFTRAWFIEVYCNNDPAAQIHLSKRDDSPWPYVKNCNLYDPLAALAMAAKPGLFLPETGLSTKAGRFGVIGLTKKNPGIADLKQVHRHLQQLPLVAFGP